MRVVPGRRLLFRMNLETYRVTKLLEEKVTPSTRTASHSPNAPMPLSLEALYR